MKSIRVLLVEDHALVRAGIRALLDGLVGVEVCAETGDAHEALRLVKQHQPDVVLMDIAMPGLNGLDATARLAKDFPSLPVIILSMHATKAYVLEALRAGAAGYILKNTVIQELEQAIKTVARGEKYLTPAVSGQIIEAYSNQFRKTGDSSAEPGVFEPLTGRQREILQLIAEGRSTREIAERLHLSAKTIEAHRAQVMQRLGVHNIAGLVRAAIRMGLVTLDF